MLKDSVGVTRAYDFTIKRGFIAPDGVNKSVILVNGQFPAVGFSRRVPQLSFAIYWLSEQPTIEVNWVYNLIWKLGSMLTVS